MIIKQNIRMAEGKGSFGRPGQASGQLHNMLNEPNLTPQALFSVPNINEDIKQNIQVFLRFCAKNKKFTVRMLEICLNSAYEDLEQGQVKKVAQYGIDALTNDQDALCGFLFDKKGELKNNSEVEERIEQETAPTIQSEAERLFSDSPSAKQEAEWEKADDAFEQYELIQLTLAELKKQNKNGTCLGYINKLYSSLLRRQGNLFLQFLTRKPEYVELLIKNIGHFSVGNMVALLLSCEDKNGEYKYEQFKKSVFDKILLFGFDNIEKTDQFEGFLLTVEEILTSTKQSYYEHFQDFKRCANMLVSEETLRKFYNLLQKNETAFTNSSSYLELILKRINIQIEQHDYYKKNQPSESSMKFEHAFFFNEFGNLLQIIGKVQKYNSLSLISYLNFLINLLKNEKDTKINITNFQVFKQTLNYFASEQTKGVIKIYLYQIMKIILKRTTQAQISEISSWLLSSNIQKIDIQTVLKDSNSLKRNQDEISCFFYSVLFEVQIKVATFLQEYSKKHQINLNQFYERSTTRLAPPSQDQMTSPSCDFQLALKFSRETNNLFLPKEKEDTEIQVVGKNNVMIPVLNLPNKLDKVIVEQEPVQQIKFSAEKTKQQLIRQLKNTKFNIPEPKKKISQPKTVEQKTDLQKELQIQIPKQQESKPQKIEIIHIPQSPISIQIQTGVGPFQKKYFVRHVLLY